MAAKHRRGLFPGGVPHGYYAGNGSGSADYRMEGQAQMNALQKKCSAVSENNAVEKLLNSLVSLLPAVRQVVCGIASWAGLLGMMGIIGGMDQGTIPFRAGAIQALICLVVWIISLRAGGWIK